MFDVKRSKLLVVLLLCCCIQIGLAKPWLHSGIEKRDEPSSASSTATESSASPTSNRSQTTENGGTLLDSSTASKVSSSVDSNTSTSSASSTSISVSAATSNIVGAAPTTSSNINGSSFNSTLTPEKLPLTPTVTPGFGVAGAILLVTGVVYTLLGIKQNRFQIYMSAAYLASLGTTVLIVYVLNPPVSNAVQGAYVVAVVMTGLIIGAAAIFFKELTEGLGCLLGGYSLSMWLLTLKRGGLIQSTGGKAGFIAAFAAAGFATSFSHHTRPYGLITLISFAGATAVVLGIDCFSRAGLKEFWAWIWDINNDLFPLGATTYPLSKGMKVESAAIIVLFLAGVVSQMKLWKIIKERREQRAKERLEDERNNDEEEENVGRRIEHHAAEERNRWEAIYGDKDTVTTGVESIRDSGFGDGESQKRDPTSTTTSLKRPEGDSIEMAEITTSMLTSPTSAGLVMPKKSQDGAGPEQYTKQAEESTPIGGHETPAETLKRLSNVSKSSSAGKSHLEEPVWVVTGDGDARIERRPSQRDSVRNSVRSSLRNSRRISGQSAAKVEGPPSPIVPEIEVEDDRSMVATVADEEPAQKIDTKRLSASSALLLRSASNRSKRSSKRFSKGEMDDGLDDWASSVAATVDDDSDEEMMSRRSSLRSALSVQKRGSRPNSTDTVETAILNPDAFPAGIQPAETHDQTAQAKPENLAAGEEESGPAATGKAKPASLTSDHLPAQLPKIALNFRTNEWAKHISADLPPEESRTPPSPTSPSAIDIEEPAPVDVSALQETSSIPQARRSASALSTRSIGSTASQAGNATVQNQYPFPRMNSQQSLNRLSAESLPSTRARGKRSSSTPGIPQVIAEDSEADIGTSTEIQRLPSAPLSSSAAHNTLLGQRDTMIRSKSSFHGALNSPYASTPLASMPEQARSSSQIHLNSASPQSLVDDDEGDNISLRARQSQLRQSSSPYPYPSPYLSSSSPVQHTSSPSPYQHPPPQTRRRSADKMVQSQQQREARLSHFRQSVAMDLQAGKGEEAVIEERRGRLWENRMRDAEHKEYEERVKGEREKGREAGMRMSGGSGRWMGGAWTGQGGAGGPDMMERHREAMRRLQARAG